MKISLVIPVKDEACSIGRLLGSISGQTRLPDEVVFVDAGSTDATADIIRKEGGGRFKLKLISIGAAYPGTARNAGVRASNHEFIAFTDAGIELDKDWLKELSAKMIKYPSADIVYGNYSPRTDTLFKQCLSMAVVPPPLDTGGGKIRPRFLASSLLKKSLWAEVGGFPDLRAAEDRIFMERIQKKGYEARRSPGASVVWEVPGGPKNAFNRFYNYSYHDARAGRLSDWHMPVLRMYAIALLFVFMGLFVSPVFFLLPAIGFMMRVSKKIFINRDELYFRAALIPPYFLVTGFLIFLIDIAMFSGWIKYLLKRHIKGTPKHD